MAGDDLRPLQADASCAATCWPDDCACDDLMPDDDDGESYLVDSYAVWDLVGGSAW